MALSWFRIQTLTKMCSCDFRDMIIYHFQLKFNLTSMARETLAVICCIFLCSWLFVCGAWSIVFLSTYPILCKKKKKHIMFWQVTHLSEILRKFDIHSPKLNVRNLLRQKSPHSLMTRLSEVCSLSGLRSEKLLKGGVSWAGDAVSISLTAKQHKVLLI